MDNKMFTGIMPALITCFDEEGALNEKAMRKVIEHQLAWDIDGFYINGSTGEGLYLSEQTRRDSAQLAVEMCKSKGKKVINHVGAVDNTSAVRLAKHAGEIGCDAISSLVPNYIKTFDDNQVLDYYKRLADASGLPVLVYCTANVQGDPVSFMEKAMKIDGVIGAKYTMFNYYAMNRITELNGGNINIINGPDEMLTLGLLMGADGGIGTTYNLMGNWYVELYRAFKSGDVLKAKEWQLKINKITTVLLKYDCFPAVKEAFNIMGYDAGYVAWPGKRFTMEESAAFKGDMIEAGFSFE